MSQLVLSLFPGIGLLDMAFELEGFCIVRGPDLLWGGDIRKFHPPAGKFDGVIGGPPCQAFSRLRYLVEANGYEVAKDLIPEFRRILDEAKPSWWLMENVPGAYAPMEPSHVVRLNNRWVGGIQQRDRMFWSSKEIRTHIEVDALEPQDWAPAVLANGGERQVPVAVAVGGSGKRKSSKARDLGYQNKNYFRSSAMLQGLPENFDLPGFTVSGKIKALGNGVPLPMGRAIAKAVMRALQ